MKKEIIKFVLIYVFVYVVLSLIYGITQKYLICIDMKGFECTFSEVKFLAFLTVLSYILTPIVAIIGFISWREQHNKQIQNEVIQKAISDLNFCRAQLDCFILNLFNNPEISPKECDTIPENISSQLFLKIDTSFHDYIKSFYMSTSALDVALNSFLNDFKTYSREDETYEYKIELIQNYMVKSHIVQYIAQSILHEYQSHYLDTSNEEFERHIKNIVWHSEDLRILHDQTISYLHENNRA
ncbi:hypothetical protein [Acinetobacter sp.]|uniref:hypothetical protein n=1 Tax=Acinetobacter sp. TaxID=472 RepID=UPI003C71CF07